MPYYISDTQPSCSGWATVNADGKVLGCHDIKDAAIKQMVAVSVATGERAAGQWEHRDEA
jgi:hypothetical protein